MMLLVLIAAASASKPRTTIPKAYNLASSYDALPPVGTVHEALPFSLSLVPAHKKSGTEALDLNPHRQGPTLTSTAPGARRPTNTP